MPAENMTKVGTPLARLTDDTTLTTGETIADRLTGSGVEADEPLPVDEQGVDPPATQPVPGDPVDAAEPAEPAEPADSTDSVGSGGTMAAPAKKADGWQVDPYRLRSFTDAVVRTRSYLDSVQAKVDRMQGAELTPQIGTSPVGQQLAKKFDDRLNSTDGLRAMLTEAMKRMDDFVASAETAARAYEEVEESTVDTLSAGGKLDAPPVKRG